MTLTETLLRLSSAVLAGIFIGLERQWHHKDAGLRTNTLVVLGACLFVLISEKLTYNEGGDATRIIGQVVTGIGFLGGGVIIREGFNVKGLNTAATLWCSAAIGCMSGLGFYIEALFGTFAILVVNLFLRFIEERFLIRPEK